MGTQNIFIHPSIPHAEKERIIEALPGSDVFFSEDYSANVAREKFLRCTVVFGNPPLEWVEESEYLDWVQLESAGLDPFQEVIASRKIKFSNLKDFFSQPVAETTLAGILTLYRNIHLLIDAQKERNWAKDDIRSACETVKGKKILILGPGSIGRMIGKLLSPMGGDIHYFGSRKDFADSLGQLDAHLSSTDILIGSLPESAATIGLLNEHRLGLLPQQAILVNVGRGSLIDETALIHLLKENKLRGAYLDVTVQEPVPPESELWEVPNLVLGQHAAGGMPEELSRKIDFFLENYANYKKGAPENIVSQ